MNHSIVRVISFQIIGDYKLNIEFDDGFSQAIDFKPVLAGEMYGPLLDLAIFNKVKLDPEVHTIVWPNGADFDPATLHQWPKYVDHLKKMSKKWSLASVK